MTEELVGVIGGTGLGDALAEQMTGAELHEVETPFGKPSGPVLVGTFGRRRIAFIGRHGPGHTLGPSEVPFAANIFALKKLGVHAVLASGAVGSLRAEIAPGDLVIVDQFIDKTFKRTNTFFAGFGAVHCEMAEPACGRLRESLRRSAEALEVKTHVQGTYVCMEGPQFSTRAESLMHRAWGGDLIGMTAMPEARLAREAQMCYALVALVSDYDCWREHDPGVKKQALLAEILGNVQQATENCLQLMRAVLSGDGELLRTDCACRKSLELAVWTNPDKITPAQKDRLAPLFE
jgi:5'-methylthioadenosine phosphorylase